MADPFLLAHSVYPLCFDICGVESPITIRDQMVRRQLIVDRALEAKLIDTKTRWLLVYGTGVAGVTAAIHAARLGVPTFLVDDFTGDFRRQAGCTSRWVDPTHYDWPVDHWSEKRYPWTPPPVELPWVANYSDRLAIGWTWILNSTRCRHPLLVQYATGISTVPTLVGTIPRQYLRVTFSRAVKGSVTHDFGMMLSCAGIGTENCTVGAYSGFRFWDTDPFEQPNMGMPAGTAPRVLISGGGDGGLQDFLRIVTSKPAEEIYHCLTNSSVSTPIPNWSEVENRLQSAEDQAQRAFLWGATRGHDHAVNSDLHQTYQDIVNSLRADPKVWKDIEDRLKGTVNPSVPDITLAYPCTHFSRCYGLNRFLVLLLKEYLESVHPGRIVFQEKRKVADIVAKHTPSCHNSPRDCHGEDHTVQFCDAPDCEMPSSGTPTVTFSQDFNVIILRHGVSPPTTLSYMPSGTLLPFPRQILPYHLVP